MGRKFRLSVHRKNEERRKRAKPATCNETQQHDDHTKDDQTSIPQALNAIQAAMEVKLPNSMWHREVHESSFVLLSKVVITSSSSLVSQPALITHCIKVKDDWSWVVFIHNHKLDAQKCGALYHTTVY